MPDWPPLATPMARRSPTKSDYTQNYEVGAKNAWAAGSGWLAASTTSSGTTFGRTSTSRRGMRTTVHGQTSHAVAKGFDLQADMAFGPLTIDLRHRLHQRPHTPRTPRRLAPPACRRGSIPVSARHGRCRHGQGTTPRHDAAVDSRPGSSCVAGAGVAGGEINGERPERHVCCRSKALGDRRVRGCP